MAAPGKAISATSITVGSTANYPTDTGIVIAIRVVDAAGELIAGTYTEFSATVTSGTTLAIVATPVYGSDQVYTAGSTTQVYIPLSSYAHNKLIDGFIAEHSQLDGTHSTALITSRTEDTSPDVGADFLLTYDNSATALKKIKPSNLGLTDGWIKGQLPAVSSVTNNGNRSEDVTFASTVASYLTPGMRVRGTRTVAAPTQCTDLESGSSQYWSKTTPSGLSFTTTFTCMAWVKLESYGAEQGIIARRNVDTEGFSFSIDTTGTLKLSALRIAANNKVGSTAQSIPLNKWVHVAASMDVTVSGDASTLMYIDGILVSSTVATTGTCTALVQGTSALVVGARKSAGTDPFDGKIAQAAVFSSVLSAATIKSYASQTLSGSETTLVSAYSFNNTSNDLNTSNANNLTAQASAVATTLDSPFSQDANGTTGSYDFGIVTKVATTVATIQFPEGCSFPTSGGVSAVDLSPQAVPYGFPSGERFRIESVSFDTTAISAAGTKVPGLDMLVPVGKWLMSSRVQANVQRTTGTGVTAQLGISTSATTFSDYDAVSYGASAASAQPFGTAPPPIVNHPVSLTTPTTYYAVAGGTFTTYSLSTTMNPAFTAAHFMRATLVYV